MMRRRLSQLSPSLLLFVVVAACGSCDSGTDPSHDAVADSAPRDTTSPADTADTTEVDTVDDATDGADGMEADDTGADSDIADDTGADPDVADTTDAGDADGGMAMPDPNRPVIYQLVVRYFGNTNATNQENGDLETNGVGKFSDIDSTALTELRDLGTTHIWLTGVLQQATNTDYSDIGQPADDPDILKGKAGSFFAVKDYYDVSPDYAETPSDRMQEFESLVGRIHDHDMKVLIDLVPNHVARTYHSDIKPDRDFGKSDDTSTFFDAQNNFFYLVDPPGQKLSLPNPSHWERPSGTDGTIEREDNDGMPAGDVPKATGNNQTSPSPGVGDWYETIKLNWGYNFADGTKAFEPVPDTWKKMDQIVAYWQDKGVDGFRCDFAHLVPTEAWSWLIQQARQRDPDVYFLAEAFETASAPSGFTLDDLIRAGFDAVYDDPGYDVVKGMFCCGKWANDLHGELPSEFMYGEMLRYAENHDERRIASPVTTGEGPDSSGFGRAEVGKPVAGTLYLLGPGPLLVFNGQTVGEPGAGKEGFGGEDGRTTIFDYWSMPQMRKWVNDGAYDGGGLDQKYRDLRSWYGELLRLSQKPGLGTGSTYSLQTFNQDNADYTKGQYIFSYLRYDTDEDAYWLVVANFDEQEHGFDLTIPEDALAATGLDGASQPLTFDQVFGGETTVERTVAEIRDGGVPITIDALGFQVYDITP